MLVMTCRVGSILRIGPDIQLSVQARQGDRITVSLLAPPDLPVRLDGVYLQPLILPSGACAHLFSLRVVRCFRLGSTEIRVWLPGEIEPLAADCEDFVHLGLIGPDAVRVCHAASDAGPVPMLSYSPPPSATLWY